jgi:hypothetical protein
VLVVKINLRRPLIVAAIVVVLRVVLELWHAPGLVTNLVSVVALYLVIFPVYFTLRISGSGMELPYRALFKVTVLYAASARALVIPTYWLAYIRDRRLPAQSAFSNCELG